MQKHANRCGFIFYFACKNHKQYQWQTADTLSSKSWNICTFGLFLAVFTIYS